MDDCVLAARLRALWNNLDFVSKRLQRGAWRPRGPGSEGRAELEADSLWAGLEEGLVRPLTLRKEKVVSIEGTISDPEATTEDDLKSAWKEYADVREKSEDILRESLEIIGTLAIRNEDQDRQILYLADELIREVLLRSTQSRIEGDYYLVVHGLEDTFTKARASILRLRFSEWTIWDLPLACHELGHVLVEMLLDLEIVKKDEFPVMGPFVDTQRDALMVRDADLHKLHQGGGADAARAKEWAESRVHELLADAFATYTLGPAYACSAILLRLDPAMPACGPRPSDAQRAEVILSMLSWMDKRAGAASRPYAGIIDLLREAWETTSRYIDASVKLEGADQEAIQKLANLLGGSAWKQTLRGTAIYPYQDPTGGGGWPRARAWHDLWMKSWEDSPGLTKLPQPSEPNGMLRDVLNAAWWCRLDRRDGPAHVRTVLEEAARELCRAIISPEARKAGASLSATT